MIARRKPIKRGKPPKRVNAKRKASEFERAYHSHERVGFVQGMECVGCRSRGVRQMTRSANAHTANGGMGRKAAYEYIIPLCHECHTLQHQIGAGSFAIRFNIDLKTCAAKTHRARLASLPPLEASPNA